jgi:hypothetical protein
MLALRRLLASLLLVVSAVPAAYHAIDDTGDVPLVAWLALALLPVAAALVFVRRLEPQILVRAVMWGVLVLGTLLAWVVDSPARDAHLVTGSLVACSGVALLALGGLGLDAPPARRAFVPVAFRGVLVAILVMAVADTATLLFWGGMVAESSHLDPALAAFFFCAGGLMLVAVAGLYGLRVWGFALNVVANVVVATGAWLVPELPEELAACLTATAIGQLVVGLPLMKGLVSRSEAGWLRPALAGRIGAGVVVGLMASALVARLAYA